MGIRAAEIFNLQWGHWELDTNTHYSLFFKEENVKRYTIKSKNSLNILDSNGKKLTKPSEVFKQYIT